MQFDNLDDAAFNELVEKGFIETKSIAPGGKPEYQLTSKAAAYLHKFDVLEALKQNSPEEILKRISESN